VQNIPPVLRRQKHVENDRRDASDLNDLERARSRGGLNEPIGLVAQKAPKQPDDVDVVVDDENLMERNGWKNDGESRIGTL
jgi:hypothetical protein